MSELFLKIENLTKNFGQFTALRDISLEVFQGEFVCFLGPSGCGKTTLLRAIAGLDIQTQGSIAQAGADISVLPPAERDFGIVFLNYRSVISAMDWERKERWNLRKLSAVIWSKALE